MSPKSKSESRKVYLPACDEWVEVEEPVYREYYRPIWSHRKRMQDHGRCGCPKGKLWICDADCGNCSFSLGGDMRSLDFEYQDSEGGVFTLADTLADESPDAQAIIEDRELLDALFRKLDDLDPEGRRICELLLEDKNEREIASVMGFRSQSSVNHRKKRAFAKLRDSLSDFI